MSVSDMSPSGLMGPDARGADVLAALAETLARGTNVDDSLGAGLRVVMDGLGLPVGGLYVADDRTRDIIATRHVFGVPADYVHSVARFREGEALVGKVLREQQPVVVEDLAEAAEARPATRDLGLRTVVFVPLRARGRAIGVMAVGGYVRRRPEADELRVLEAAGAMLGGVLDVSRLLDQTARHRGQLGALWELDRALIEDHDIGEVLRLVVSEAAVLARGDTALALFEGDRGIRISAAKGEAARDALGHPPDRGTPLGALLASAGPATLKLDGDPPSRALVVPLVSGDRPEGALVLVKKEAERSEDDLTVLASLGQRASLALAKGRAREAEGRRAGQLALVSAAAEIAASTLDLKPLLSAIARFIQKSFGYYAVTVYLVSSETREAVLAGASGAAAAMPKGHRIEPGTGLIGWVAEHGEYVLSNDVRQEPRYAHTPLTATLSELAVPVRLAGEVVAVINVESDRTHAFDEGDVLAVDGIACQVASSIRNARLFEEKVRALRNLEILQETTNVLNSELDLDALLERIARRSVEAVRPSQMGAVLLYDAGALIVRSSYGYAEPIALARVRLDFHEGLPGAVFVSGQGRVVSATPADYGRFADDFAQAAGGVARKALLCVPVSLPQEKLGILLLESSTAPEAFYAADLRFVTTLANQAAIAIGNALHLRRILEMDRHRQEYLSNVSHELRTPLTVIQGYVESVASGEAGEQSKQFLDVARQQCDQLGRMIDEVLEVSRLEQGVAQRHLKWGPVPLRPTLERALRPLRQEAMLRGITVREHVPDDLPPVPGDDRLLQLLLFNLVENALKFSPTGAHVDVDVRTEGDDLVLAVRDDGIGIAAEHHERIFDKFFMVDGGERRRRGGAGIGLYLVKEVVAIHAGSVRVESEAGKGTRLEVRLPLRQREA